VIDISFTDKAIADLRTLQNEHPDPVIRRRALVLLLKSRKIPHHQIAQVADVCENTVRRYLCLYQEGGLAKLVLRHYYRPQPRLASFEAEVREYLDKTPPATITQACTEIAQRTEVLLKPTQMRAYLKSLGVARRKVGSIPAKADIEKQKEFHDKQLQPRLAQARAGKRAVYFVDAAHFVLGAFLGYLWSMVRLFVKTPSGRQRLNVLGALNAVTKELVTIINDTYITSQQVCELLHKLAEQATIPITLVLDNARYQRCALVITTAKELDIELLFLPPYSPNLNLIERLWKLVKKECLYSIYYENFALFRQSIQTFLSTMHHTHQHQLQSLLTLNFQTFTPEQFQRAA
jgi:transposase